HLVEQRLEHMGVVDQALQPEGAGAALDRMEGAERRVHGVCVAASLVERHQMPLDFPQQLLALLEIELFQFGQIVQRFLRSSASCCYWQIRRTELTSFCGA